MSRISLAIETGVQRFYLVERSTSHSLGEAADLAGSRAPAVVRKGVGDTWDVFYLSERPLTPEQASFKLTEAEESAL